MKDQLEPSEYPQAETSAPQPSSAVAPEPEAASPTVPSAPQAKGKNFRSAAGARGRSTKPAGQARSRGVARPARPPRPAQPAHSARPAQPTHHSTNFSEEDDGFFARHRAKIIGAVFVLLLGGAFFFIKPGKSGPTAKAPERMVSISLPPLPKPPPPPPPKVQPPPPKEEKMVQETAAEEKPKEAAPKAPDPAPAPLGTGVKGDGPGLAGLGSSGNGGGGFGGNGGGGGSKWGWYAGKVQARVAEALRRDSHTKSATMRVQVRIWPDATGRVTKAKLDASTGDKALDTELERVLTNIQLTEPPPTGMPMPIVMRLTAARHP